MKQKLYRKVRMDMMRIFKLALLAALLCLVASGTTRAYTPLKAAPIPNATMMHIHIGSGEKAIDVDITDSDEIAGVIGFVNAHLDGWKPVDGSPPIPEVNVRFFDGQKPVGTFGSDANFFTRGNPASLTHAVPAKDVTDFLNLANIDPAKLQNPPH